MSNIWNIQHVDYQLETGYQHSLPMHSNYYNLCSKRSWLDKIIIKNKALANQPVQFVQNVISFNNIGYNAILEMSIDRKKLKNIHFTFLVNPSLIVCNFTEILFSQLTTEFAIENWFTLMFEISCKVKTFYDLVICLFLLIWFLHTVMRVTVIVQKYIINIALCKEGKSWKEIFIDNLFDKK